MGCHFFVGLAVVQCSRRTGYSWIEQRDHWLVPREECLSWWHRLVAVRERQHWLHSTVGLRLGPEKSKQEINYSAVENYSFNLNFHTSGLIKFRAWLTHSLNWNVGFCERKEAGENPLQSIAKANPYYVLTCFQVQELNPRPQRWYTTLIWWFFT